MNFYRLTFLLLFLIPVRLLAQPVNDDCINAIELTDVTSFCSGYGAYNNFGASPSIPAEYVCIPNEATARDVWFRFTAIANFVNIKIVGKASGNNGGTLLSPQMLLYSGPCSALVEVNCFSDAFSENQLNVYAGPLIPGETYYINVSARNDNAGSFQLCINNYDQTFVSDGDCPTSRILCDKSSVYIESVFNPGQLTNEIDPSSCVGKEKASSWFRWACSKSGTLTISLTPLKPEDDLDFALFELPGGINDCSGKKILRCGAAGENVGQPYEFWKQCTGPTGLNFGSQDVTEFPGCNDGNDNWVRYIDMEAGKSYAFFVNNFSRSGEGYYMEFGGTGEFLGARADFNIEPAGTCYEDTLTFINLSTEPTDPIVSYQWNFGSTAIPESSADKDPPPVKYQAPGHKSATLTIKSEDGCVHSVNKNFIARCCIAPLEVEVRSDPDTAILLGDYIDMEAYTINAVGNVTYEWQPSSMLSECFDCNEVRIRPFYNGIIYVTAEDDKGCIATDSIEIRVIDLHDIFAPNVFSPNYDGINDHFNIFPNPGAKSIRRLRVFNRWGACVYEGRDLVPGDDSMGWDGRFKGKECNPDVFAYYAEVEFLNGRIQLLKGSVTLVR